MTVELTLTPADWLELVDAINELRQKVCRLETALGELSFRTHRQTVVGGA
jgi:hypothetical protein